MESVQQFDIRTLMVVLRNMPLPEELVQWNRVIQIQVSDKNLMYTWVIHDGKWEIQEGLTQIPNIVLTGKESQFVKTFMKQFDTNILPLKHPLKLGDSMKLGRLVGYVIRYLNALSPNEIAEAGQRQLEAEASEEKTAEPQGQPSRLLPTPLPRGTGLSAKRVGTIKPEGPVAIDMVKGGLAIGCGGMLGMGTGYRLYRLDNFTNYSQLPMDWRLPRQFTFSQSGNFLASAEGTGDYYIEGWVYNLSTGKLNPVKMGGPRGMYAAGRYGSDTVSISPNGRFLLLASTFYKAVIIDLHSNREDDNNFEQCEYLEQEKWGGRKFFVWSADSKTLVTFMNGRAFGRFVSVREFPQGEETQLSEMSVRQTFTTEGPDNENASDELMGLDISADSWLVATGGGGKKKGIIQILSLESNAMLIQSQILPTNVRALKFTPSGEYLLSGDRDGNLTLWKLDLTGKPELKAVSTVKCEGAIQAIGMDQPDDGLFVAAQHKGSVNVYQVSLPAGVN